MICSISIIDTNVKNSFYINYVSFKMTRLFETCNTLMIGCKILDAKYEHISIKSPEMNWSQRTVKRPAPPHDLTPF